MSSNTKRSVMTLYSDDCDLLSHRVRIVLAEKEVTVDVLTNKAAHLPEEVAQLNPYSTLPILVDRDLVLYDSRIIMEYLDERFPHPPLLPVYPIARARTRLTTFRIEQDWYQLSEAIEKGSKRASDAARKQLEENLIALNGAFLETPYFLSQEFSLIDCSLLPLLWRLPKWGIHLTGPSAKGILQYAKKLFKRPSFQNSLTESEREFPRYDF